MLKTCNWLNTKRKEIKTCKEKEYYCMHLVRRALNVD